MSAAEEIFDEIITTSVGRAFVFNLLDGYHSKIIGKVELKRFVEHWHSVGISAGKPCLDTLDHAANSSRMTMRSKVAPVSLPDLIATSSHCGFWATLLRSSATPGLSYLADLISDYYSATSDSERALQTRAIYTEVEARSGGDPDGLIDIELPDQIAGPMEYFWCTSFADGDIEDAARKPRPSWGIRADLTRDILGLIHIGSTDTVPFHRKPELMAVMVVDRSAVPTGTRWARPTCIDAGSHSRFRAGFGDLRKRPYEWGRALHLERFVGSRPHRGGRELVVENFAPTTLVRFTILGEVFVPRRDVLSEHDDKYAECVSRGRDMAVARSRFVGACS